ncbi:MAG: hypothetical protein D6820_16005, partial [Lentisphaerae bacterium]
CNVELLQTAAPHFKESVSLFRVGYIILDGIDLEHILARRYRDMIASTLVSTNIDQAELHAELTLLHIPEPITELAGPQRTWLPFLLLGCSYNIPWYNGIDLTLEYYRNPLGLTSPDSPQAAIYYAHPNFTERRARGDFLTITRNLLALQVSYAWGIIWSTSLAVHYSLDDGSHLIIPSLSCEPGQRYRIALYAYHAHGSPPRNGIPASEFGAQPRTFVLQFTVYF